MKNTIKVLLAVLTLFILNFSFLIHNCMSQWVQMSNGMGNIYITSLAVNGNNIFAGTWPSTGIYISTNNGTNWTHTSLNNQEIRSLLVNGNNIFTGTKPNGVFLSTDNGTSWAQTSLNSHDILSLAVNGNNIFAGSDSNGVYLSTNNGTTWNQTSLNNRNVWSLAVSGSNIFAGTYGYGVFLSTDNGTTWTQTSLINRTINALAVNGNNIFAGTTTGVYISTDNGTIWTQTSLNNHVLYSLAVNGNNVFAGTGDYNGVFVSSNNGTNWTQRNEGLGNRIVAAFCILNNYMFAGTYNVSVYRRPLGELITGIQPVSVLIPKEFKLMQNYPNPFNPITKINFDIPVCHSGEGRNPVVNLVIYDALGRKIETLVNQKMNAGSYSVDFNASNLSGGVYFCRMQSAGFTDVKKLVLLK
ncbi:MAG: T9SS type A sorting domain-containing protein [Ignavibacteriae bacterium]|nr:T9SS type A sorting domain-containing protein [Ignavibacteriota bacterium]